MTANQFDQQVLQLPSNRPRKEVKDDEVKFITRTMAVYVPKDRKTEEL